MVATFSSVSRSASAARDAPACEVLERRLAQRLREACSEA